MSCLFADTRCDTSPELSFDCKLYFRKSFPPALLRPVGPPSVFWYRQTKIAPGHGTFRKWGGGTRNKAKNNFLWDLGRLGIFLLSQAHCSPVEDRKGDAARRLRGDLILFMSHHPVRAKRIKMCNDVKEVGPAWKWKWEWKCRHQHKLWRLVWSVFK